MSIKRTGLRNLAYAMKKLESQFWRRCRSQRKRRTSYMPRHRLGAYSVQGLLCFSAVYEIIFHSGESVVIVKGESNLGGTATELPLHLQLDTYKKRL